MNVNSHYQALIFIVGNSRSGTTLVARMLTKHPDVYILNETHFMEEFKSERENWSVAGKDEIRKLINRMLTIQRKDYYRKSEYEEYSEDAEEIISAFEKSQSKDFATLNRTFFEFEARKHGKSIPGDQTPRNIFYIMDILKLYPEARFVHMVRDPRAVLFSQKNKWRGGRRWGQPRFEIARTFFTYHPITTSIIWKKSVQAGFGAERELGRDRMQTVLFEKLTANPKDEIHKISDFLGISFVPEMLDVPVELSANVQDEGKQGVQESISERWTGQLSRTEVFLAEKIVRTQMIQLGYELTGIRPNLLKLIAYLVWWPMQLATAIFLNLGRTGNPFTYVARRLFRKHSQNE